MRGEKLIFLLHFHSIEIVGDNLVVCETHILGEIGGADPANPDSVSLLCMPDSSRIGDTLKVGDIFADSAFPKGSVLYTIFAVLLGGEGLPARLAEIPGFDRNSPVGDNLSVGDIDETGTHGTSLLIPISEILLEFIGIVRSVIGFAGELTILGIAVEIGVRTSCREDGFDLLLVVSVGDFGNPPKIVLEREFVDDDEFSSLVQK